MSFKEGSHSAQFFGGSITLDGIGPMGDDNHVTPDVPLVGVNMVQRWGVGTGGAIADLERNPKDRAILGDMAVFSGQVDGDAFSSGPDFGVLKDYDLRAFPVPLSFVRIDAFAALDTEALFGSFYFSVPVFSVIFLLVFGTRPTHGTKNSRFSFVVVKFRKRLGNEAAGTGLVFMMSSISMLTWVCANAKS